MTELEQKQKAIIDHYGVDEQLDMLVEECAELIQAICKCKRYGVTGYNIDYLYDVMEEMADVENLIEQINLGNKKYHHTLDKFKNYKVNRQLERIALEKLADAGFKDE